MAVGQQWSGGWVQALTFENRNDNFMTVARCEYFYFICWSVASRTCVSSPHFRWCEPGYLIYVGNLSFPLPCQLYYWTYSLASKRWRNLLCWIVGCASYLHVWNVFVKIIFRCQYNWFNRSARFYRLGSSSTSYGCNHYRDKR